MWWCTGSGRRQGNELDGADVLGIRGLPTRPPELVVSAMGTSTAPAGLVQPHWVWCEVAHPVPDGAGVRAAQRMLATAQFNPGLWSGAVSECSGLLTLPAQWAGGGLTLAQLQRINPGLLASGASISEDELCAQAPSHINGGRHWRCLRPARWWPAGDQRRARATTSVIASGPRCPDRSTCAEPRRTRRYGTDLPAPLLAQWPSNGELSPQNQGTHAAGHQVHVIATPQQCWRAAARQRHVLRGLAHILVTR